MPGNYAKFAALIAISTLVMFILMYLNTWDLGDVWFSQTRIWMAIYVGAAMTVIMGYRYDVAEAPCADIS